MNLNTVRNQSTRLKKDAHYKYANKFLSLREFEKAVYHYQTALGLGLKNPEIFNNLGIALKGLRRYGEAVDCYSKAIGLDHKFVFAYANLGYLYIETGVVDKAIEPLQKAIQFDPDYADAHWLYSHVLLLQGRYSEGWKEYEWRWRKSNFAALERTCEQPRWQGENLSGRTILLWAEQGMGDAIQFLRFVPNVKQLGANVLLECQPSLNRIVKNSPGIDMVISRGEQVTDFDVHCSLLSLPLVLGTTVESIPAKVPYIYPALDIVHYWKNLLAVDKGLKIGIVWAGNPSHVNDLNRSINPKYFTPFFGFSGLSIYSLQKGFDAKSDLPLIKDYTSQLTDFADTAGLIDALDVVITVDTSVAHLAGAMGKNVWLLLPLAPDWRWMRDRSDSPWYPTMKLFRQTLAGDWRDPLKEVAGELLKLISMHHQL